MSLVIDTIQRIAGAKKNMSENNTERRAVMVSVAGVANNSGTQCNWITTVVCDDGSIWWMRDNDSEWRDLPPLPKITLDNPIANIEDGNV